MTWYELFASWTSSLTPNLKKYDINKSKNYKFSKTKLLEICQIYTKLFYILVWKQDYEIFTIIIKNIEKALKFKKYINLQLFVSEKYYDLLNIFEKQNTNQLLSYQEEYNIEIKLKFKEISNFDLLYSIFKEELQVL